MTAWLRFATPLLQLAAANRAYRARVKNTTRSDEIDDNVMDEDAWAVRPKYVAADQRNHHSAYKHRHYSIFPREYRLWGPPLKNL